MGEKLHEVEKQYDLFESDKKLKYNIACNINFKTPMNSGCAACGCQLIPLSGSAQRETIVPANNTSTTQFVFGQERSLFPHPRTRNINQGKSKEINLSATKKIPGQKPTVSKKDTKRRAIRRLHMNNSLSQLMRKCKLRF